VTSGANAPLVVFYTTGKLCFHIRRNMAAVCSTSFLGICLAADLCYNNKTG